MVIKELVTYLKKCDDAYYNTSNPLVSDAQYDAMVETLKKIDPTNEYLSKVGAKVRGYAGKIGRVTPMGTLSKYHKEEEIQKWLEKEKGYEDILLSPKYDGFAVELVYMNGLLVSASTRGDGFVGEDVLSAVMRIESIPINLQEDIDLVVRGEAIIPLMHHDHVKELGYTAMRNAVPGIVRSNRAEALRYVDFVAYEFIDGEKDRVAQRDNYRRWFIVEDYHLLYYKDIKSMNNIREGLRESYKYELDGVVLKTRVIQEDDLLHPDHMVAWKYKSNREVTTLLDIEYQLGLTGYFTPIGIFDPVEFQGATLTRASLGNMTRLATEFDGITAGSLVEVSRRGDIIPYIESMVFKEENSVELGYLTQCPHCGSELAFDGLEPHCVNRSCPEKLRLQISQYVKSVGIKGIGDSLIRGLIDGGYVKSILDVYTLNPVHILNLPRQGSSSAAKWVTLQEKKLSALELLTAYPFIDLGKKNWEIVLSKFSYKDLMSIDEITLSDAKLRGLGDTKIKSIVSQVREFKDELISLGTLHEVL